MRTKEQIENAIKAVKAEMTDRISSLEKDLKELQGKEKTYPVGYDPDGEWSITIIINQDYYKVIKIAKGTNSVELKKGHSFTTKEQAEQKAAGLNALRELVFAIHEENEKISGKKYVEFMIDSSNGDVLLDYDEDFLRTPPKLRMKHRSVFYDVLEKLGEEKIKLALEHGL